METKAPPKPVTVVVLGAGMSGLAAAYELMKAGYDVKVLEGRDVPGGRVQTMRQGFTDGHYAEAGAMFLPGDASLTLQYAKQFGVPLEGFAHYDLPILYYLSGQRLIDPPPPGDPPNMLPYPITTLEQELGLKGLNRVYCQAGLTPPTGEEIWPPDTGVLDQVTYATKMQGLGASTAAIEMLAKGYLSMYGDGPNSYSALMMMYDEWYTSTHPDGFQVKGGNDVFPATMAAKLGNRISYGSRIVSVTTDANKVQVTVESAGAQHIVEADYAICALPYKVLVNLPITPAVYPVRRTGLLAVPCTSVVRVCLEFKTAFWLEENLCGLAITDLPIQITYPQPNQDGPTAVLNQLMTGDNARAMAALSEADRLQYTLTEMAKFYPKAPAEYIGGVSKVWDTDPWTLGAYAAYAPTQMTTYLPVFQQPEGRLYFAGDYMSLLPGWIEGALRSGCRAVTAIAGVSGGNPVATPLASIPVAPAN
jgi:monoamine oxidase